MHITNTRRNIPNTSQSAWSPHTAATLHVAIEQLVYPRQQMSHSSRQNPSDCRIQLPHKCFAPSCLSRLRKRPTAEVMCPQFPLLMRGTVLLANRQQLLDKMQNPFLKSLFFGLNATVVALHLKAPLWVPRDICPYKWSFCATAYLPLRRGPGPLISGASLEFEKCIT